MPRKILVFKHMACQNPGVFRDFAKSRDIWFHEIDLYAGDSIPELDGFDGLWVMGGSMNVWEEVDYPWLTDEKRVIAEVVLQRQLPFFGICLGHQLLAEALGGEVGKSAHFEIGIKPINTTHSGRDHPLIDGLPELPGWVNVHLAEVKRPPENAIVLARSDVCDNHIMAINDITYSCQFHPEVNNQTVADWLQIPGIVPLMEELTGKQGVDSFQREIEYSLEKLNSGAEQLFENWVDLVF